MASLETEIGAHVMSFIEALEARLPVDRVIVFGSYAAGTAGTDSDIDLAVVSPAFGRNPWNDRRLLYETIIASGADPRIEPHPFAPEDLEKPMRLIVKEILSKGVTVYEHGTDLSAQSDLLR